MRKFRMAMTFLLTVRGIPQLYYGTEIAMTGWEHAGHGFIREDFPGGWADDESSVKEGRNLKDNQREAFDFMQMLLNWRKEKKVIHYGKTTHYVPENGVYVYFRHDDKESVMIVLNNNEESRTFTTERFAENLKGFTTGKDVLHRTWFDQLHTISVPAMSARIIELNR
jgi:glycosidase